MAKISSKTIKGVAKAIGGISDDISESRLKHIISKNNLAGQTVDNIAEGVIEHVGKADHVRVNNIKNLRAFGKSYSDDVTDFMKKEMSDEFLESVGRQGDTITSATEKGIEVGGKKIPRNIEVDSFNSDTRAISSISLDSDYASKRRDYDNIVKAEQMAETTADDIARRSQGATASGSSAESASSATATAEPGGSTQSAGTQSAGGSAQSTGAQSTGDNTGATGRTPEEIEIDEQLNRYRDEGVRLPGDPPVIRDTTTKTLKGKMYDSKDDYMRYSVAREYDSAIKSLEKKDYNNQLLSNLKKEGVDLDSLSVSDLSKRRDADIRSASAKDMGFVDWMGYAQVPEKAAAGAGTMWLVNKLASSGGRQTNAQLYGQQPY